MIHFLWPSSDKYEPRSPVTLLIGEIEDYDFSDAADQIYRILSVLQLCSLIDVVPYRSSEDVFDAIHRLVNDIDFGFDELQISESNFIRVEFRDEMLSLEVYVGV